MTFSKFTSWHSAQKFQDNVDHPDLESLSNHPGKYLLYRGNKQEFGFEMPQNDRNRQKWSPIATFFISNQVKISLKERFCGRCNDSYVRFANPHQWLSDQLSGRPVERRVPSKFEVKTLLECLTESNRFHRINSTINHHKFYQKVKNQKWIKWIIGRIPEPERQIWLI